jgi:DNA-binding CsgD family transcriptional regulator/PAS domain-containing protein
MSSHDRRSAAHCTRAVEPVSSLIADIYDAALDPTLWTDALPAICEFVGGQAGGIVSKDAVSKAGTPHYHFGVDPHYVQMYSETHSRFDLVSTLAFFDIDQVVNIPELVPYDEFRQGRFFHEWMRPQGWIDTASSVLEKSALSCSCLTILRKEVHGMVDDEMRRRMALVVPHVRRAMLIGRAIELKTAQASAFADTLDGISAGMFLVDANGRIVHANARGQAILDERSVLRAGGGKLTAIEAGANHELNQTLALAGGGDAAVGVKGITVPLAARDGEHYVAHALPLTSGERRRAGASYAAVAALFVRKAGLDASTPPEAIARLYKLTPTELRVLLAVVEVGGVPEVAEALGIGEATVKTHLHRLFAKTGTSRQAELVKLVAGFSSPLVS